MSEKDGFPSAYSSFAVSVDSRNAERPVYSTAANETTSGILRQSRPTSAYARPLHEKKRSLSPNSWDKLDGQSPSAATISSKPGVRFTKDTVHEYNGYHDQPPAPYHHRRSSTAAFLEYIRKHIPENQNRSTIGLTPKRALMLFAIVFSATYLALGLLPMLAGVAGFGGPVTVVIRRGDGYYGNSRIFRGGENLADPHLAGDEHHQYLAHAANSPGQSGTKHGRGGARQRTLKSSTLAEEASLQELKVARAKAKAEAVARAQLLMSAHEDEDEDYDTASDDNDPDLRAAQEAYKAREEVSNRRRPLMPLKKLAERVKGDREAREKAALDKETMEAEVEKEAEKASATKDSQNTKPSSAESLEKPEGRANLADQDEAELEGIIAKLRQEALDRRLRKIHAAQKDVQRSQSNVDGDHDLAEQNVNVRLAAVDAEAKIRRPGIVKSRKVSTKEE